MYILGHMIDMGLLEGQDWPSPAHRVVAGHLALCNSRVTTKDSLVEVCQAVIAIPEDRIQKVTLTEAVKEFNVPHFSLESQQ